MPSKSEVNSFQRLNKLGMQRFTGTKAKWDQVAVVCGPIVKYKLPGDTHNAWAGDIGMYILTTFRLKDGQWVYNKFRNFWQIDSSKIIKYARGVAKTVYYIPNGSLAAEGKVARSDFKTRPPQKFKRA